jgi:hypothetical protein
MTAPLDANGKPLKVGDEAYLRVKIVARYGPFLSIQFESANAQTVTAVLAEQLEIRK